MNKIKELKDKKRNSINPRLKIQFSLEIAILHTENNNFKEAFEEYEKLLELAKEENDFYVMASASRQMGECLLELQKPSEALEHIKQYHKIAQDMSDIFEIQRASVTMGRCYLDIVSLARNPHSKQAAAIKSENAFIKSLQTCHKISETPDSDKLYQKNMKLSSTKSSSLKLELAEMRTVSLFNIGLVNREKGDRASLVKADKYFSQCAEFAVKEGLWDMFLRSSFQRADTKYTEALSEFKLCRNGNGGLSKLPEEAISIIRSSLNQLVEIPFTSAMKRLRKDIWELHAQCMVLAGQIYKAAKKYRNIMKHCPAQRADFELKMICASALHKKLDGFNENTAQYDDFIYIGRLYDKLLISIASAKCFTLALHSHGTRDRETRSKLINKIITLNMSTGNYADNIALLERKLRDHMKMSDDPVSVAAGTCNIIEQLLECWLRSGTAHEQPDRVLEFIEQMDNLATVSNRLSIQITSTRTIVQFFEDFAKPALKPNLLKAKEKLERLEALFEDRLDGSSESDNDDATELELSDIEFGEIDEQISSDSEIDIRTLSEGQIEELEAVGKRVKPSAHSFFVKRNEKGETLLHVAAIAGKLRQVEKLVEQMNHPIDEVDSAGWTALHDAANHGHTAIVEFLLDHGANIEHTGPVIDKSTPLMEAVHGGNLDTATVLIERGANLWHKNRLGENLGDCIDAWRQRCKGQHLFKESQALAYRNIMVLIKNRLGVRYIEWCRDRKGGSACRENVPPSSGEQLVSIAQEAANTRSLQADRRRDMDVEKPSDSEEDERGRSRHVRDYVATIRGIQTRVSKNHAIAQNEMSRSLKVGEAGYVIGDDWLEDDMRPITTTSRLVGTRLKRVRSNRSEDENISDDSRHRPRRRSRLDPAEPVVKQERQMIANKSHGDSDCNTQKPITDSTVRSQHFDSEDELFGDLDLSAYDIVSEPEKTEPSAPVVSSETSGSDNLDPLIVSVTFRGLSMLVPVPLRSTVHWLIEETAKRFGVMKPDESVPVTERMRVATEDGILLLPYDELADVLAPMRKLGATINLLVGEVDVLSGLPARLVQMHKRAMAGIDQLHQLDIHDCNLKKDIHVYLGLLYSTYNVRGLTSISLAGNGINDDILTKPFTMDMRSAPITDSAETVLDLAGFIGHHSATLEHLDLSSNFISGMALSNFLLSLRSKSLRSLKLLNLSDNPIGSNDFCVVSLVLNPILAMAPSLEVLRVCGCEISNFSEFSRLMKSGGSQDDKSFILRELDLSRNPSITIKSVHFEMGYFWQSVASSLRYLSLRECGSTPSGADTRALVVHSISAVIEAILNGSLRLTDLDISACALDTECVYNLSKLFKSKNSSLSRIACHNNPVLSESVTAWCTFVHDLHQPACQVKALSIDLPSMSSRDDYDMCLYTLDQKVRLTRFGVRLHAIRLWVRSELIGPVRHALLEHAAQEYARLTDEAVSAIPINDDVFDGDNGMRVKEHYSRCFVVSVLDALRDCSGGAQVPVEFKDDYVSIGTWRDIL